MKKYLIKYKWQNFLLFLLLVLTSGVSTGYAFLQMYIGKQVMEGNFRMVLITVVCNTVLIFGNSILFYIQNKYQTYLIAKMNQDFRNDISNRIMSASFEKLSATDTGEYYRGTQMMFAKRKTRDSRFFTAVWKRRYS